MKLNGCGDCAFFDIETNGLGRCHRYPPTSDAYWPRVMDDDWCGEMKLAAKDPRPLDLPDELKVIVDRARNGDPWRPVKVPLTGCRACNGTGHSLVDIGFDCRACQGLGLARQGDEE